MSNVYEDGQGDARQTDAAAIPDDCKLFRKRYRQLSPEEVALHDAIKDKADELAALIAKIDQQEDRSNKAAFDPNLTPQLGMLKRITQNNTGHIILALRHLEDCVYRAVKALTA